MVQLSPRLRILAERDSGEECIVPSARVKMEELEFACYRSDEVARLDENGLTFPGRWGIEEFPELDHGVYSMSRLQSYANNGSIVGIYREL